MELDFQFIDVVDAVSFLQIIKGYDMEHARQTPFESAAYTLDSRIYWDFEFFSFQSIIFDEVDLTDASVAESSTKNVNNSFTVGLRALFSVLLASFPHIPSLLQSWTTPEQSSQHFLLKRKKMKNLLYFTIW